MWNQRKEKGQMEEVKCKQREDQKLGNIGCRYSKLPSLAQYMKATKLNHSQNQPQTSRE